MTEFGHHLVHGPADIAESMVQRALPSVTVYNRLEGRPRTVAFDRSLRAEVRDPLWMLTRQWQVGEFAADDAGSPVLSQVHVERMTLTELGAREFPVVPFDASLPLETRVERRPVVLALGDAPLALDLRLALGRRWEKLLTAPGTAWAADYRQAFRDAYPIAVPDPDEEQDAGIVAHLGVWQSVSAVAGRALDGGALFTHLTKTPPGHPYDGVAGVVDADKPALDALGTRLVEWFRALIVPASVAEEDAWDPQRLEYRFRTAAAERDGSARRYLAPEYHGGRLDWWALDRDAAASDPLVDPTAAPATGVTATTIPANVTFEGMPSTRWWTFEDGRTNLGAVDAATTDVATLLFLEYALVYANDWFLSPVEVPVGSIAQVRGLAVTTVFGERYWITPAGAGVDDTWQRWSMFSTSLVGAGDADTSLLMLPVVAKVQQGPPLEQVALVRDEMANMVWGLERDVPSATGEALPGALAATETTAFFRRLGEAAPTPTPPPRVADVKYEVTSSVPENWIPFVPVRVPGDFRQIQLQRGSMPRIIPGLPIGRVEPRTALLRTGRDEPTPEGYLLHEEEVGRAGTVVAQAFQRTRALGGRAVVWVGATRGIGHGEGSSGLAFDRLVDVPPEEG